MVPNTNGTKSVGKQTCSKLNKKCSKENKKCSRTKFVFELQQRNDNAQNRDQSNFTYISLFFKSIEKLYWKKLLNNKYSFLFSAVIVIDIKYVVSIF